MFKFYWRKRTQNNWRRKAYKRNKHRLWIYMIETYHTGKYVKYNIHCVNSIEEIEKRRDMSWAINIHAENVRLGIDSDKQGNYTCVTIVTRRMPYVEEEGNTPPKYLSYPPVLVLFVLLDRCLSFFDLRFLFTTFVSSKFSYPCIHVCMLEYYVIDKQCDYRLSDISVWRLYFWHSIQTAKT
jgi:hypothetical protein